VTRFSVADEYASKFERQVVGAKEHEELWVPAEELAEFNAHIGGTIEVTRAFFGDDYGGHVPDGFGLRGKPPVSSLSLWRRRCRTAGST
jgi:hypothetical protein